MSGYQSQVRWKKTDGCTSTETERGGMHVGEGQERKDITLEKKEQRQEIHKRNEEKHREDI